MSKSAGVERNTVAVFGASGALGQGVVRGLSGRGFGVRAVGLEGQGYEAWVRAVEDEREALEGVVGVIDARSHDDVWRAEAKWVEPFTWARRAGVRRYIYVSSCSTLWRGVGASVDEGAFYEPRGGWWSWADARYGVEAQLYREVVEGLSASIVIPSHVLDSRHRGGLGESLARVVRARVGIVSEARAPVVSVKDVATAAIAAMARGKVGRRYVLAGQEVSMRELVEEAAKVLKVQGRWLSVGERWAEGVMPYVGRALGAQEAMLWGWSAVGQWAEQELEWRSEGLRGALLSWGAF